MRVEENGPAAQTEPTHIASVGDVITGHTHLPVLVSDGATGKLCWWLLVKQEASCATNKVSLATGNTYTQQVKHQRIASVIFTRLEAFLVYCW